MNLKFLIFPTLLFASCAVQPKYQDVTLEGEAADVAFREWSTALPREMAYPVDYRFDFELGLSGVPEMDGVAMTFKMGTDASFASAWHYRFRSDFSVAAMGQEMGIQLGASADDNELRLTLDNAEMIEMMVGTSLPSGVSLSTDRLRLVWDLIMHLTEMSMEVMEGMDEYEDFGNWVDSITGFGDFVHPMLNSRYLAMSPLLQASRWQIDGDTVSISFGFDRDMMAEILMAPEMAEFGLDASVVDDLLKTLVTQASFNVLDGSMDSLTVSLQIPITDDFGEKSNIDFSMVMRYSPLQTPVGQIEFSDPDTALDLNDDFDQYWPMVEAMMPMFEAQMRQQLMLQSDGDGGDFEF